MLILQLTGMIAEGVSPIVWRSDHRPASHSQCGICDL